MSYQDRKDIDNLYFMVWDKEKNDLRLATKDELNALSEELHTRYLNNSEITPFIEEILRQHGLID